MKLSTYYQVIGVLFDSNHIKESLILAEENWLERKVKHPETGNMVKVKSLPKKYRDKYKPKKKSKKEEPKQTNQKMPEEEAKRELDALKNVRQKAMDKLDEIYKIPLEHATEDKAKKEILTDKAKHRKIALKEFDDRIGFLKGELGLEPLKGKKIDPEKRTVLQDDKKKRKAEKSKPDETEPEVEEPLDISIFNKRPSELEDEDIFDFLMEIKEKSGL